MQHLFSTQNNHRRNKGKMYRKLIDTTSTEIYETDTKEIMKYDIHLNQAGAQISASAIHKAVTQKGR